VDWQFPVTFHAIAANILAGLGLLFSGLRMVDVNLRQVTGRRLRTIVGRLTRHTSVASAVGVVAGAVMQSSSGIVFILVSLVTSGLATVRAVLPIIIWANVGCSALIFVAVLDLRLGVLYLIGLAGATYALDRFHRNHVLGALFGIGLLLYGIELMKTGASPLSRLPLIADTLSGNRESYVLALLGGTAFSFATQSSTAASILAIGLAEAKVLGPFPAMMAIYGANVGSTFARMLLSSGLRGSVRQLAACQDLFKIGGVLIFVPLLYLEAVEGVPLVGALVRTLSDHVDRQLALVFLLFNLTMAIACTLLRPLLLHGLELWLPADDVEDFWRPRFLYDEALNEPSSALDLIEKEQRRLVRRLRTYADAMRTGSASPERQAAALLHAPFASVASRIDQYQHELGNRQLESFEMERVARYQQQLSLVVYLEESLRALAVATEPVPPDGRLGVVVSSLVEALDFVLLTLEEALDERGSDAVETLVLITQDRGSLMERIRQEYLADDSGVSSADRALLLRVTSIFERIIWMTQRLARVIEGAPKELAPALA